jgi:ATP-dependent helicase/nuclease subunit B
VIHQSGVASIPAAAAGLDSLISLPGLERVRELLQRLPRYPEREQLSPALAERLYLQRDGAGRVFRSSVSRLETFAACPFRFLAEVGLRAEERKQFEVDQRERGTLQHEVLERFHHEVTQSGRRWRDVPPEEAVALIGRLVDDSAQTYRDGLFLDDERNQFTTATLKDALQRFIRVIIGWMRTYQLDPSFVELSFGLPDSPLPPWRIPLGDDRALALRGLVDRVDLSPGADESRWCVVLDYKSGAKKLDPLLLHNGLQLQLASYLGAIQSFAAEGRIAGCSRVRPAGMFYANLRGVAASGESRDDVLRREPAEQALAYRHYGRFNADALPWLDRDAAGQPSGQFNFKLKKDGTLSAQQADPLPATEFAGLLDSVRVRLEEIGRRILAGEAAVDPYRHNSSKPCDRCEMGAVCRIDTRAHRFRTLAPPPRLKE